MSIDPGLTDSCISIDDGPSAYWWMSPDIELIGSDGVSDRAQPGGNNQVRVRIHRQAGCTLVDNPSHIVYEVWVGIPTASPMTPGFNSRQIASGAILQTSVPSGGTGSWFPTPAATWTPPATVPAGDPEAPGHKCLIARVYPNTLTPDSGDFHCPDDPHVAQRNICIQTCSSPCDVEVVTGNPAQEGQPKEASLKVVADLKPDPAVMNVLLPLLKEVKGFQRVSNRIPVKGFGLEFRDFPNAKLIDNTRPGCLGAITGRLTGRGSGPAGFQPSFEGQITLKPGQTSLYRFVTDLDGSEPGEAHIFHLMHLEAGRVLGGLTIGMVKT